MVMDSKHARWRSHREAAVHRLTQLSDMYSTARNLPGITRDDQLALWFTHIANQACHFTFMTAHRMLLP